MGIVPFSSEEKFMKPCHVPKKFYALKMFKLVSQTSTIGLIKFDDNMQYQKSSIRTMIKITEIINFIFVYYFALVIQYVALTSQISFENYLKFSW